MTKNTIYILLGIIVILIVVYSGIRTQWFGLTSENTTTKSTQAKDYSAVFLSNGQVYFGKLTNRNSEWLTLKDIYYLQVSQQKNLQPTDEEQPKPNLSLVKLGNELHGPLDEMTINNKHVIFYEDLKNDGKVTQSIKQYLENQNNNQESNNSNESSTEE